MSKKIKYTNEPVEAKIIKDFLPKPEDLVLREENIKVTISLSKKSVDFFKSEAKRHHIGYQTMIRNLLDKYTDNHAG